MMIIVLLLLSAVAFLSGFLFGIMCAPKGKVSGVNSGNLTFKSDLDEEYENFLKYDGSEQF